MTIRQNEFGQPIGETVIAWQPRQQPSKLLLEGQYCLLEYLNLEKHAEDLFAVYQTASSPNDWTYLPFGPFTERKTFFNYINQLIISKEQWHYAVIEKLSKKALGSIALMRADVNNGTIEVGFVTFSRLLKKTRVATEAQYLLMQYIFDELGYRRYEWKCDALNQPSKNAAIRLGFQYEGTFRQAVVYKSRSRDTAWYSIIDKEWPNLKSRFQRWLNQDNFDLNGHQKSKL